MGRAPGTERRWASRGALRNVVAALWMLAASPAAAEDERPAEALLAEGRARYAEGFFESAVDTLERAASQATSGHLAGQIQLHLGLSLHAAGRVEEARAAFRRALRWDPTLELDEERFKPEVVALFRDVRASMEPASEEAAPLGPGTGARRVPEPSETARVGQSGAAHGVLRDPDPGFWQRPRVFTWVMWGAAVATGAAGLGLAASGKADHDEWSGTPAHTPEADALERSGKAKLISANVMFGLCAASAITALVLLFREGRQDSASLEVDAHALRLAGP